MPVAWDEIPLPWGKRKPALPNASDIAASFSETDALITVNAKDTVVKVDRAKGVITSVVNRGEEWLRSPLTLNFWRPPTNNDEGAKLNNKLKVWQRAGQRAKAECVSVTQDGKDVLVTADLSISAGQSKAAVKYRITGGGQIVVDTDFRPDAKMPDIPRIGYQGRIPSTVPVCKWYGRGPHENYVDRKSGAWTTIHDGIVPMMFHRYVDPQESGNRSEIRWFQLSDPMGRFSMRVDACGDSLLETAVYPCGADDITLAMHSVELPKRDFYTLNVDHRQSGVGGTDSWGALALPRYRISSKETYQWSFMLSYPQSPSVPQGLPSQRLRPGAGAPKPSGVTIEEPKDNN